MALTANPDFDTDTSVIRSIFMEQLNVAGLLNSDTVSLTLTQDQARFVLKLCNAIDKIAETKTFVRDSYGPPQGWDYAITEKEARELAHSLGPTPF